MSTLPTDHVTTQSKRDGTHDLAMCDTGVEIGVVESQAPDRVAEQQVLKKVDRHIIPVSSPVSVLPRYIIIYDITVGDASISPELHG